MFGGLAWPGWILILPGVTGLVIVSLTTPTIHLPSSVLHITQVANTGPGYPVESWKGDIIVFVLPLSNDNLQFGKLYFLLPPMKE